MVGVSPWTGGIPSGGASDRGQEFRRELRTPGEFVAKRSGSQGEGLELFEPVAQALQGGLHACRFICRVRIQG